MREDPKHRSTKLAVRSTSLASLVPDAWSKNFMARRHDWVASLIFLPPPQSSPSQSKNDFPIPDSSEKNGICLEKFLSLVLFLAALISFLISGSTSKKKYQGWHVSRCFLKPRLERKPKCLQVLIGQLNIESTATSLSFRLRSKAPVTSL